MTTYRPNSESFKVLSHFEGAPVFQPKYRCGLCYKSRQEQYDTCRTCEFTDDNQVGTYIHKLYAVGIYLSNGNPRETLKGTIELDSGNWPASDLYGFYHELQDAKDGRYTDKMAEVLAWGVRNYDSLDEFDLLVAAPSASAESLEENHMAPIGERLAELVDIPFLNIAYGDFESQSKQDTLEDRISNVRGNVKLTQSDLGHIDRAIVIDNIATSCVTVSDTGRALREAGVGHSLGLVMARNEDYRSLESANALTTDQ